MTVPSSSAVLLTKMSENDFKEFLALMIPVYAESKVKNGDWNAEGSVEKAIAGYRGLLPEGINTPNHFLLNIEHNGIKAGCLWWCLKEDDRTTMAYLYEIIILEPFRNKGIGTLAMQLFIKSTKEKKADRILLHVFGFNLGAVKLYQRLGFSVADYTMQLRLSEP